MNILQLDTFAMMFRQKLVWLCTFSIFIWPAIGTGQAATPACSSAEFDVDGDGWGWENHRSCIVTSTTASPTPPAATEPDGDEPDATTPTTTPTNRSRHPACVGTNADPDGDGWGWENNRSCIVLTDATATDPVENEDDEDNANSNPVDDDASANPIETGRPACELANSDPDGDGWGWENNQSCVVVPLDTDPADDGEDSTGNEDSSDDDNAEGEEPGTPTDPTPRSGGESIVYTQDFETAADGLYQSDQLNDGWNNPFWHLGFDQGRVMIVPDKTQSHGQVMKVTFPAGAFGSNGATAFLSDVQFGMELPETYDELYLSYDIKFADDFDFVLGGKLPGLCGANSDSALTEGCNTGGGIPSGFDGWSARSMWRADGELENYMYHAGQQNFYADSLLWNVRAQRGSWHRIQHRVVLNTVGASDGIIEAWLDGQRVLSNNRMEYRKTESVGINLFYFSTFFGGNDPSWAPQTDQILYFDNFIISTEKTD